MAIYTNRNGTSADDTLTYNKGGTSVVYHTGNGNDTVAIKDDSIKVVNDGGSDIFTITGGSGHSITGSAGVDTVRINGGNIVDAQLGSGRDVIVITNSDGKKISGLAGIRGGEWTDTFTTEANAQNYQLYGDAGDDVFNINGGNNLVFWGGAGIDTFTVKGGNNNKIYGGDSADKFDIYAAKQNIILGYGNDIVNVKSGNNQQIKANLGINIINLNVGNSHIVTADIDQVASKKAGKDVGYGQDKLVIAAGVNYVTAHLGDGRDVIEVNGGTGHKLFTEGWSDTITVNNTVSSSFNGGDGDDIISDTTSDKISIYGGAGRDTVTVTGKDSNYSSEVTTGNISTEVGNDTIKIKNGGFYKVYAGDGNDTVEIYKGSNIVYGGYGDDVITVSSNKGNYVHAGDGNDTIYLRGSAEFAKVHGGNGNDTIVVNGSSAYSEYVVEGGKGNDTYDLVNLHCGVIIDNSTGSSTDKDVLIIGGNIDNIDDFVYDARNDMLAITDNYYSVYRNYVLVKGFSKLSSVQIGSYKATPTALMKNYSDLFTHYTGDLGYVNTELANFNTTINEVINNGISSNAIAQSLGYNGR